MADMMFYARQDDADELKDYIKEHGERVTVRRGRDLSRFNEAEGWICWVRSGAFKCVRRDFRGRERVLGFMFEDEMVANYLAPRCGGEMLFRVVAMEDAVVYALSIAEHAAFFEREFEGRHYVSAFVEGLAFHFLHKTVSLACLSPWERLEELLRKVPDLFARVNRRDVAACIGVSPETLSRKLKEIG